MKMAGYLAVQDSYVPLSWPDLRKGSMANLSDRSAWAESRWAVLAGI